MFFQKLLFLLVVFPLCAKGYFISYLDSAEKVDVKSSFLFHGNATIMIEYPCSNQIFIKLFPCWEDNSGMGCIEVRLKKNYLLHTSHLFLGANYEVQWKRILEISDLMTGFYNLILNEVVYFENKPQQIILELKDRVFRRAT